MATDTGGDDKCRQAVENKRKIDTHNFRYLASKVPKQFNQERKQCRFILRSNTEHDSPTGDLQPSSIGIYRQTFVSAITKLPNSFCSLLSIVCVCILCTQNAPPPKVETTSLTPTASTPTGIWRSEKKNKTKLISEATW